MSTPAPVPVVTPGFKTSEGQLTLAMTIVGVIVTIVTIIHPGFKISTGTQQSMAIVLSAFIPGMIAFYQHSRARVKVAAMAAQVAALELQLRSVTNPPAPIPAPTPVVPAPAPTPPEPAPAPAVTGGSIAGKATRPAHRSTEHHEA